MKAKRKKRILTALIALAISLILATGLEALQVATQPAAVQTVMPEDSKTIFPTGDAFEWMERYENIDGMLIRAGDDPQLHFYTETLGNIRCVGFEMAEPPAADLNIQIFYGLTYMGYSEENSVRVTLPAGGHFAYSLLPGDTYQSIRIDIDGAEGFTLRDISVSSEEPVLTPIHEPLHKQRIAIIGAGIWLAFLGICAIRIYGPERETELESTVKTPKAGKLPWKEILLFIGVAASVFAILWVLVLPLLRYTEFNMIQAVFCILAGVVAASLVTFRKTLGNRPENFFVLIALCTGLMMAIWLPTTPWVSWDDETHFSRALAFSYVDGARYTLQDNASLTYPPTQCTDLSELGAYEEARTDLAEQGAVTIRPAHRSPYDFWQIPAAVGLYLGRVLHLGYDGMWRMGRIFSLLAYTAVGYFAIRRLRSGKLILTAVLLAPTALFLASNYSYDPGVTSLTALGFSYLFAEWQERDRKLRWFNAVVMIMAMTLGCLAKAVYCPMLLIPLFLPREKFTDKRQRRYFFGMTLSALGLLLLSFLIPFLTGGSGGDTRGGADVSSAGQTTFIMNNPISYAGILLRFLGGYLSPAQSNQYIVHMAYRGLAPGCTLYLILLGFLTLTDRNRTDNYLGREKWWTRIPGHFLLFGAVVLCATAMYISFTPVGLDTINGCQGRYLLPVLFPSLMMIGTGGLRLEKGRSLYHGAALTMIAIMDFTAVLASTVAFWTL